MGRIHLSYSYDTRIDPVMLNVHCQSLLLNLQHLKEDPP